MVLMIGLEFNGCYSMVLVLQSAILPVLLKIGRSTLREADNWVCLLVNTIGPSITFPNE